MDTLPLFDASLSRTKKEQGMIQAASPIQSAIWLSKAREKAVEIATRQGEVSIEDIYRHIGLPDNPNAAGSVFRGSKWVVVGRCQSTRPSTHSREVKIWALRDASQMPQN